MHNYTSKGNINSFETQRKAGRIAEIQLEVTLREHGYDTVDVSENPQYFDKGIDYLVTNKKTGKATAFDSKYESQLQIYHNFCFETISNKATSKPGWLHTSQQDFFSIYDVETKCLHIISAGEVRLLYQNNKRRYKHKETKQLECGKYLKKQEIVLIPEQEIFQLPSYRKLKTIQARRRG